MANIWACFCLAFTASYTANLGGILFFRSVEERFWSILAAFMITKEIYYDLSGITDTRVGF